MKSKSFPSVALLCLCTAIGGPAVAANFGAGISPTKFELRATPGATLRDTVTILNANEDTAEYALRTADWSLNDMQGVEYLEDALAENSCRPWVKLERSTLRIPPGVQKRYRFEVHVPEDAPVGLCKFAILIAPAEAEMAGVGANREIRFPVVGRYAVTVYVTVGDARPEIEYLGLGEKRVGKLRLPTLELRNTGNTYDRTFGQATATDAAGKRHRLVASSFPVLPGRTESILLALEQETSPKEPASIEYPLTLKGRFEIGGRTIRLDGESWGAK